MQLHLILWQKVITRMRNIEMYLCNKLIQYLRHNSQRLDIHINSLKLAVKRRKKSMS